MMVLFDILTIKIFSFPLLLFGSEGVSFGIYEIKRSLTPLGWTVVIIVPLALIFGTTYLIAKILKKPK
ncbi:MAG: hypothetical protein ACR2HG_06280 [Pyrinomonadaceae bacterium]